MKQCLVIYAKYPEIEGLRSRLGREADVEQSYRLVFLFIRDLVNTHKGNGYDVAIAFTPKEREDEFNVFFSEVECYPQEGKEVGEKLFNLFKHFLERYDKVIVVVSDVPNLRVSTISRAFRLLDKKDVILGPCYDGGCYLGGMKEMHDIFGGVNWNRHNFLEDIIKGIKARGLSYSSIIVKKDVDKLEDLKKMKSSLRRADAPLTYEFLQKIKL